MQNQGITLIDGNGYETRKIPLLYVFVLFFGLDPAQNTIGSLRNDDGYGNDNAKKQ